MEEKDVSKRLALVLIVLTVVISAASSWVLITKSMDSGKPSGFNDALIKLHIMKGPVNEVALSDSNSGNARLYISKGG